MGAVQSLLPRLQWKRHLAIPLVFLASSACLPQASDPRSDGSWTYEVDAPTAGSRTVTVRATFEKAKTERLSIIRETVPFVEGMEVWNGKAFVPVERRGSEWIEASCTKRCTVRYQVNLSQVAAACGDEVDCARRVGDATLSPALAWLVHPVPKTDVPATVRVRVPQSTQFMSGMHATDHIGTTFGFRSYDLDEGSFTAFGPQRQYHIQLPARPSQPSASIDVSVLGTTKYAMTDPEMRAWIEDAAQVVTPLFGRFPVEKTSLFVVPAKGEGEVVFGKVLSLAGASVVLVVGDKMPGAARHHDWVLVHELFHLGFPTFRGEGRWLGEGLATYYEPVLRARAGWTTEADVFRQFARNMPRGMPKRGMASTGLVHRDDLDSIYWGGALFCFAADVRIREETQGKHSLDDVIRASLARGGDATKVWTVAEVVQLGDEVTGTKVLSEMYERYAARGDQIDFDGLLGTLGIERADDGVVGLDDSRPLAWVRRDIVGLRGTMANATVRRGAAHAAP